MQELSVLENLAFLHVVSFRVAETSVEVLSEVFERSIFPPVKLGLNVVEGNGSFYQFVVIGILSPRRQTHEREGGNLPSDCASEKSASEAMVVGGRRKRYEVKVK